MSVSSPSAHCPGHLWVLGPSHAPVKTLHAAGPPGPTHRRRHPFSLFPRRPRRPPQMGQPRRRGYPHGHHHRCHRRIALPAAALALLFLAVSLLSVSFLSAPPLTDPRTRLATSSSRRFLRRYPVSTEPSYSPLQARLCFSI